MNESATLREARSIYPRSCPKPQNLTQIFSPGKRHKYSVRRSKSEDWKEYLISVIAWYICLHRDLARRFLLNLELRDFYVSFTAYWWRQEENFSYSLTTVSYFYFPFPHATFISVFLPARHLKD